VPPSLDPAEYELFVNRGELLPLWLRLRAHVLGFGPDVRIEPRLGRYAEIDRGGLEFALAEPAAHRHLELGLHNPGLPFDERFRDAEGWGTRRITHRVTLPESAEIDAELHARLHDAYMLAPEGEPR
jgi:hypothetical protein